MLRASRIAAAAVALLIILIAAADLVAGHVISSRIRTVAGRRLTGPISVSLGGAPALADAVSGSIQSVTLDAPDTTLCRLSGVHAHISLHHVRTVAAGASVGRIQARVLVAPDALTARLPSIGSAQPTITPDPVNNALRFAAGPGGVLQFEEVPTLHDRSLILRPSSITLFGQSAPPQLAQLITRRATVTRPLPAPLGLRPTDLRVTGSALQIELESDRPTVIDTHRPARPPCP